MLQLNVQEGVAAFPTVFAPTPLPTNTVPPSDTPGPATATPADDVSATSGPSTSGGMGLMVFLGGLLGALAAGVLGYVTAAIVNFGASRTRIGLSTAVGAMVGYNYLALGLPGSASVLTGTASFGGLLAALAGGLLTLGLVWTWVRFGPRQLAERS